MATQWNTFPIEFKGGLISNMSPLQQGLNAIGSATKLENMEPNRRGGYTKIKGYEKFSATEIPGEGKILGLHVVSSGRAVVARKIDAAADTAYGSIASGDIGKTGYYWGTGTSWNHIATSGDVGGGKVYKATFNFDGHDKTVFVDGTNYPVIFNAAGNTATVLDSSSTNISTDVQGAELVSVFKNSVFYAKGTTVNFTVPFTAHDFTTGNGAGSISVGNTITGMIVFREQLIIFTQDSIKRLVGNSSSDFKLQPITEKIGCISPDSVQEFGGDVIYMSPDGIRLLSATDRIGDFALDVASNKIYADSDDFLSSTTQFASVILREKGQYRIFAYIEAQSTDAAKGLAATKFLAQGADGVQWFTTKGLKVYIADSVYSGTAEAIMFANNDGYLYEMEQTNAFDGDNIQTLVETPYMPITDPEVRKTAYKLTLYTNPTGQMNLKFRLLFNFDSGGDNRVQQPEEIDVGGAGSTVGIVLFGSPQSIYGATGVTYGAKLKKVYEENLIGSFKTAAMRITSDSTDPPFTLDSAVLQYRQNDRQ